MSSTRRNDGTPHADVRSARQAVGIVACAVVNGCAISHISYLFSRLSAPVFGESTLSLFSVSHAAIMLAVSFVTLSCLRQVASTITSQEPFIRSAIAALWLDVSLALCRSVVFRKSERLGPAWGPQIIQAVVIPPLIALLTDGSLLVRALMHGNWYCMTHTPQKPKASLRKKPETLLTALSAPLLLCGPYLLSLWLSWWSYFLIY